VSRSVVLTTWDTARVNPVRLLYQHRHILYATTRVDKRSLYIGPLFGLGWAVLYPRLLLGLYAVVYALIPQIRLERFAPFETS
jgi:hypothetical protein